MYFHRAWTHLCTAAQRACGPARTPLGNTTRPARESDLPSLQPSCVPPPRDVFTTSRRTFQGLDARGAPRKPPLPQEETLAGAARLLLWTVPETAEPLLMSTLYEALIHDFLNILLISPLQRPEVKKLHKNVLAIYCRRSKTLKRAPSHSLSHCLFT